MFVLVLLLLVVFVLLVREEGGKEFSPQHDMLLGDVTLHRRGGSAVDVLQKDGAGDSALQLVAVCAELLGAVQARDGTSVYCAMQVE